MSVYQKCLDLAYNPDFTVWRYSQAIQNEAKIPTNDQNEAKATPNDQLHTVSD